MPRNLDQVMEQYRNVGNMNISTPQPPPYVIPNAFRAPSYGPPPQMMQMGGDRFGAMVGRYGGYDDIVASRARQSAGTAGSWVGAAAGFGVGMVGGPKGAFLGAGTGEFLGGLAGTALGYVPGISHAFRGYQRLMHGGAIEQMAATNTMQQGMYGRVSLGAGAMGAGGGGINPMAAHELMQSFSPQRGGFDRQTMASLTSMAAETGFLDTSSNISQISGVVKKLAGVMGEMARITGDPDFRKNMRELSNMRDMGLTVDQSLRTLKDMRMFGRMAGGIERAQAGAMAGAQAFQQYGLTGGLGRGIGAGVAGMAGVGMGQLSPIERGLYGGQEGVQNTMLQGQAQFLGQTAKVFLPYVLERGKDGKLQINQQKLNQLRGGKLGLNEIMSQGQANLAGLGPHTMEDMLNNLPALQTQMGQQAGGAVGVFAMQAALAKRIQQQTGVTLESAANIATGSREAGVLLARHMNDPEMIKKMQAQTQEDMRHTRAEMRDQRAIQRDLEPGAFKRTWNEMIEKSAAGGGWLASWSQRRRGAQSREAWEQAREQAEEQDRAMGVTRYRAEPGMITDEEEQALATKRVGRRSKEQQREELMRRDEERSGWQKFWNPLETSDAVDERGTALERTGWGGSQVVSAWNDYGGSATGRRALTAGQLAAADIADNSRAWYNWSWGTSYGWEKFKAGFTGDETGLQRVRGKVEAAARSAEENERVITGMQKLTVDDFARGEESLIASLETGQKLGAGPTAQALAAAKQSINQYAYEQGSDDSSLDPGVIRQRLTQALIEHGNMPPAEAKAYVDRNSEKLTKQAYHWIGQTGDPNAKRALANTEDAANVVKARTYEDLSSNRAILGKKLRRAYTKLGLISEPMYGTTEVTGEEDVGITSLYKEEDADVRALSLVFGGFDSTEGMSEGAKKEFLKLQTQFSKTPEGRAKFERARKLSRKLTPEQRRRLATQHGEEFASGGSLEKLAGDIEQGISGGGGIYADLGIRPEVAAHAARMKAAGLDVSDIVGPGAGGSTAEGRKRLGELGELDATLNSMAAQLNEASANLMHAANVLQSSGVVKAIVSYRGGS